MLVSLERRRLLGGCHKVIQQRPLRSRPGRQRPGLDPSGQEGVDLGFRRTVGPPLTLVTPISQVPGQKPPQLPVAAGPGHADPTLPGVRRRRDDQVRKQELAALRIRQESSPVRTQARGAARHGDARTDLMGQGTHQEPVEDHRIGMPPA